MFRISIGDNEMQTGSPHSDFTIYKHAAALPRTIRSNIIFAQNYYDFAKSRRSNGRQKWPLALNNYHVSNTFVCALILDQFTMESRILFIVEIISGIFVYDAFIHTC